MNCIDMKFWNPTALLLACTLALPAWGAADDTVQVPAVSDLQAEGVQAQQQRLPIALIFSAQRCGYCAELKHDFIEPMLVSGQYTNKVLFRVVELEEGRWLHDFDGRDLSVYDIADRYGVKVTPTVVLVDAAGAPLGQKLVGLSTPDYYGAYLDDAIDRADEMLRARFALACKEHADTLC